MYAQCSVLDKGCTGKTVKTILVYLSFNFMFSGSYSRFSSGVAARMDLKVEFLSPLHTATHRHMVLTGLVLKYLYQLSLVYQLTDTG